MKWKNASAPSSAPSERRWPEKVSPVLVVLAVVALVIGTPLVSTTVLSKQGHTDTVVVSPHSYSAIHYGLYGFGMFQYSCTPAGFSTEWSDVYLLEMDRINFVLFEDGRDYEYLHNSSLYAGGSGITARGGLIWEVFLVVVNDSSLPVTVEFEIDSTVYFSLPAAILLLGAVVTTGYVTQRRSARRGAKQAASSLPKRALTERKKALIVIAGLVLLASAITIILGNVLPTDSMLLFGAPHERLWIAAITCAAFVFAVRSRLQVVKEDADTVFTHLAQVLRASGYMVTDKTRELVVRVSLTSGVRITVRSVPEGALISYRTDAMPVGWGVLVMLLIVSWASPVGLAVALFMFYRSAVFADDRILPILSISPPYKMSAQMDTRAMLVESLSEGRRLSTEAYEAARSNYHDSIIVLASASMIVSTVLAIITGTQVLQDLSADTRVAGALIVGVTSAMASSLIPWRLLAKRYRPVIDDLRSWSVRLETALYQETSPRQAHETDSSAFELIVESYKEIPKWLRARRKAGMFTDPGDWMVILLLSMIMITLAAVASFYLSQGELVSAAIGFAASLAFGAVAASIYIRWRRRREEEDRSVTSAVATRYQNLKTEMETYLRSV